LKVSGSDINGVTLQLSSGVSLAGHIRVDGMPLSNMPGWENVRVPLKPTLDSSFAPNLQPAQPVPQRPLADGTFIINGVSPGEFIVGPITGVARGFYVKEARFNQADVLGQPLRFFAGGNWNARKSSSVRKPAVLKELLWTSRCEVQPGRRSSLYPNGSADGRISIRPRQAMSMGDSSSPAFHPATIGCSGGKLLNPTRTSIRNYFAAWSLKAFPFMYRNRRETASH
jgi:hypothetical protein